MESADFKQMTHRSVDCEAEGAKNTNFKQICTEVHGQFIGLTVLGQHKAAARLRILKPTLISGFSR